MLMPWGMSLWQRLCLRSFCKRPLKKKHVGNPARSHRAPKKVTGFAKDVQTKVAGRGWGEGGYIDAQMGAPRSRCGGRINT